MDEDDGAGVNAVGVEVVRVEGAVASRRHIEAMLVTEGLATRTWGNEAGYSYGRHAHDRHKVLVCVSGSIVFHTDAGDVALGAGDRMELPPGIAHGATVGRSGVECVEAYRP